jgi:hypothetical protein
MWHKINVTSLEKIKQFMWPIFSRSNLILSRSSTFWVKIKFNGVVKYMVKLPILVDSWLFLQKKKKMWIIGCKFILVFIIL